MSPRTLSVRLCEKPVGMLRLLSGSMVFSYDTDATRAISLSMPLREEAYKNRACEAFFGGLLPDAAETKRLIARLYGINSNSNFSLLEKIGLDCAGAVSVCDPSEPLSDSESFILDGTVLSDDELHNHLKALPARPLFVGVEGMRISLAGAQDKAALCVIDGRMCVPKPRVPTTHILKPPIRHVDHSVENEYLCMQIAKRCGLEAPHVELRRAGDILYLLIERFDRVYLSGGRVQRIHQEDFCQALGVVSTKKYQADGGPSLKDCFNLMDRITYPLLDKRELLKRVIFNYIIGNADCHAKNFSILRRDARTLRLAPAYDLLSTAVYSDVSTNFAMAIGGESDINSIRTKNWHKFFEQVGVQQTAFKDICLDLAKRIIEQLPILQSEMADLWCWNNTVENICTIVESRIDKLNDQLTKNL